MVELVPVLFIALTMLVRWIRGQAGTQRSFLLIHYLRQMVSLWYECFR